MGCLAEFQYRLVFTRISCRSIGFSCGMVAGFDCDWRWRRWCWGILRRWRRRAFDGCWHTRRLRTQDTYCWGWRIFSYSSQSAKAILYYILTYGLTTIGAFGAVAVVERAGGSDRMDAFLGLAKRNGLLAAVMMVLFLSLAGIPPLVGFWAKFNLFAAVLKVYPTGLGIGLVALAVAMSAVSLYYYLQVLKRVFVMPAADATPIKANHITMSVLALIALAVVVLGCLPGLLQTWMESFYAGM